MAQSVEAGAPLRNPVLKAMLEAGGVWLWDCDLVADVSSYQEGFWEQYGYDRAQFLETFDFIKKVHRNDLTGITRAWRSHLDGETEFYAAEWRLLTAAGEWRWIRSRGRVIARDPHGKPLRIVGTYSDITDLKESQADTAQRTAELDAVFTNSRDGLVLVGPDLTILRANQAAIAIVERLSGFRAYEGCSVVDIPAVTEERVVLNDIRMALTGVRTVPERLIGFAEAGLWAEASYSPVYRNDGTILGVAIGLRDVTDRKRMELSRLNTIRLESMGLLASGVAHDFNNLLAAIVGNIELAELGTADDETRAGLADAKQAARRASELVRELLAFAGDQAPAAEQRDLSALVHEIVRYARKIPGNTAAVVEDLAQGLPLVQVDSTRIRQVVLNLVVNAFDATRERGGTVAVRTFAVASPRELTGEFALEERAAPRFLALEVSDDGPGMDAETRAHIWDPFFTTKLSGHGLGLPSVLGAVRSHGGTVCVRSEPGHGATFTVFLPVD
jgi:PAS domain S-box-containing protein